MKPAAAAGSRFAVGSSRTRSAGSGRHGAGQRETLALAARERGRDRSGPVGQADIREHLRHASPHRLERPGARLEAEGDIVVDALHDELPVGVLEDQPAIAGADLQVPGHLARDIETEESGEGQGEGALAGAARTQDEQAGARRQVQIDVRDGRPLCACEPEAEAAQADRGARQGASSSRAPRRGAGQGGLSGSAPDRRTARSMAIAASGRTTAPEMAMATAMASSASGA